MSTPAKRLVLRGCGMQAYQPHPSPDLYTPVQSALYLKSNMVDVSEQDLEFAGVAKEAFNSHRYESCLSVLSKLLETRRQDPHAAHNRAVSQYLVSNSIHTDEFRKALQCVSSQVRSRV